MFHPEAKCVSLSAARHELRYKVQMSIKKPADSLSGLSSLAPLRPLRGQSGNLMIVLMVTCLLAMISIYYLGPDFTKNSKMVITQGRVSSAIELMKGNLTAQLNNPYA